MWDFPGETENKEILGQMPTHCAYGIIPGGYGIADTIRSPGQRGGACPAGWPGCSELGVFLCSGGRRSLCHFVQPARFAARLRRTVYEVLCLPYTGSNISLIFRTYSYKQQS